MKHFKKIESKFLFSLLIMSVEHHSRGSDDG